MSSTHRDWALFRFAVVGPLFSDPPQKGELKTRLLNLSERVWTHPTSGDPAKFAFSTIERWYHKARHADDDPLGGLARVPRSDRGKHKLSYPLVSELGMQYKQHSNWSYQLHHDNLVAFAELNDLKRPPSYSTVRRYMKANGMVRQKRPGSAQNRTPAMDAAAGRQARYETRGFEKEHVGALWHLDFHQSSILKVLTQDGRWIRPHLLGIIDDHSRIVCHLQWYEVENSENLAHGLIQALLKRDKPRSILSDNGSAELAAEITEGLPRLGIEHDTTIAYCPNQNGKQEVFWAVVEGRLMAMLESVDDLTHERLNEVTQAWVEMEYNRTVHSETHARPLDRYLNAPSVLRASPSLEKCRDSFRREECRRQRRSDGTISLHRRRFEIPSRYRHFRDVTVRFAKWDLSYVHLVDPVTDTLLCRIYPVDKAKNADGERRPFEPPTLPVALSASGDDDENTGQLPSLMRKLLEDYSALGLPPAFLSPPQSPRMKPKEQD